MMNLGRGEKKSAQTATAVRLTDQNRTNMLNTVFGVVTNSTNKVIWKDHVAFSAGVESLSETMTAISAQAQLVHGKPGASDVKEQSRLSLCTSACEIIGAVRSYAAVTSDPELAASVNFARSQVTSGKVNEVVARCQSILDAATEHAEALSDYGITTSKVNGLKKKIEAFDAVKTAPQQSRVVRSAAAQILRSEVSSGVRIVRKQLDGLMLQFQASYPNFYQEYSNARSIVQNRTGRASDAANVATLPATGVTQASAPVAKAA